MTNTGYNNTGHYNTGRYNTGDYNTGHYNTGRYNTGHYNTGDYNTGDYNTGDRNTGRYNTGDCNTGDCNTGHYNTGSFHVGCFNTLSAEKAYYFNQLIDKDDWDNATKPSWIFFPSPATWVGSSDMTDAEKAEHPTHKTTGGYLRKNDMKEEWAKAFAKATPEDIELTKALPAFDAEVFFEITGVDLRDLSVLTAENASLKSRVAELEALLSAVTAYHNGEPSKPPHTGRAKTKLGEVE